MNVGQMQYAKRLALQRFDEWVDVTGFVKRDTGYYYELASHIEDAVEIGAGIACGASKEEIFQRIEGKEEFEVK